MIKVEGNIINQPFSILIDSGEIHFYIDPNIMDQLHLEKIKLEKEILVQLATGTKRRIHDMVRSCSISLNNGYQASLRIIPFEALYGRKWNNPASWDNPTDRVVLGSKFLKDMEDQVVNIKKNLKATQDRQKVYANKNRIAK
jgi:hypothetical protein